MPKSKGPTWLKDMSMTKVDAVDRPADEHALIAMFKNEGGIPDDFFYPEGTILKGDGPLTEESATIEINGEEPVNKEEGEMPKLKDEVLKGLPDEVLSYIGHLETELSKADSESDDEESSDSEDSEDEESDDMEKSLKLPDDVVEMLRKRDEEIEALRKSADASAAIAKAERDLRITREWRQKVDGLDSLTFDDKDSVVKGLKDLSDTNPDLANAVLGTLEKANGQAESAALFSEIGKGAPAEGSAEGKMEAVVKSIMASDEVSEPEAWDLAMQRNPDLYADYITEGSR